MFKKLGLPAVLLGALAGCGGNPIAIDAPSASTLAPISTESTTPPVTEPIATLAPVTVAPIATEPPTTPATTPATTPPTAPPAPPAPTGDLEVLTATGVGNPLTQAEVVQTSDSLGFTADSAGNYSYYAGPTAYPFVNVDNGRLISVKVKHGEFETSEYSYAVDLPEGQTAETIATAAAAPLKAKYPDYATSTSTSSEDGVNTYTIDVDAPKSSDGEWTVTAVTDAEYPTLAVIHYDFYSAPDPQATGPGLVTAAFLPSVQANLAQATLPEANISQFTVDAGIGLFGNSGTTVTVDLKFPDQDYATMVQTLTALAGNGWTLGEYSEPEDMVYYDKDKDTIRVFNSDEYEYSPTKVTMMLNLDDNPVGRPGGA